jgi:hypothetical protein
VSRVCVLLATCILCSGAIAQSREARSRTQMTTTSKVLARMESDPLDPERKVLTIDRITSSGTRILWEYSPGDVPRSY